MKTLSDLLSAPELKTLELSSCEQDLMLEGLLGLGSTEKFLHLERPLSEQDVSMIYDFFMRFSSGEPLAYILGYTYFDDLKISVSPQVLIPRPDSETIVHAVLDATNQPECLLLDLCTGSGAIGLAFKHRRPMWQILATDISPAALEVARQNAARLALDVEYKLANLLEGLGQFDVIAVNPPYIAHVDLDLNISVRDFEPGLSLFSGVEGLDHITRIIKAAPMHLTDNGLLCVEHGHKQGAAVRRIGLDHCWLDIQTIQDLSGKDRVTRMRVKHDR